MTSNIVWRMVRRLLGQIFASIALGIFSFVILVVFLERISKGSLVFRSFARGFLSAFGAVPVYMTGSFVFFLFFMIVLNWRRFRYVQELSRSVEHIAQGNFDDEIPVRHNNEVRLLAENMNLLVGRLKWSMEEERKAERSKNELVTNVSHDLRTPLTSIIGYLGLIDQDRYRDEVELRHYVQIAHAKALRLNLLINDLFEYTRMSGGAAPLRWTSVNLVEMMNQLLDHYRLPLEEAGMEGRLNADPHTKDVRVWADPDKLVRVFENLLANAMTYGRDGDKVDIKLRSEAGEAVAEVINYGEPIPAMDIPYLFERFYRVDKSRTGNERGSGLGLAIVKGLVEKHAGTIHVTSDERSTVFQVRLPLLQESEQQLAASGGQIQDDKQSKAHGSGVTLS